MVIHSGIISYLFIMSIFDIKEKKVPVPGLILGTVMMVFFLFWEAIAGRNALEYVGNKSYWQSVGLGMFPGWVLIVFFTLTRKVGLADGIVLCQLGIVFGLSKILEVLFCSLIIMAVICAFLIIMGKCRKDSSLPFLPFLFCGYIICLFRGGL